MSTTTVLEKGIEREYLKADLVVGFQYLTERYTSYVTCSKTPLSTQQPTLSSPNAPPSMFSYQISAFSNQMNIFEVLKTEWKLTPSSTPKTSCWLQFQVEFKFKSMLYNEVSEMFMQEVATKMVQAFETRCQTLMKERERKKT
jgi:coenzyme Q-binding protein COQ10